MFKKLTLLLLLIISFSMVFADSSLLAQDNEDEEALQNDLQLKIPNETDNPTFSLVFIDPSDSGVFLSIDGSDEKEISSPYTLPVQGIGKHTLLFKYTDAEEAESTYETTLVVIPKPPEINPPTAQDNKLLFSGTGSPGSKIKLFVAGGSNSSRDHTDVKDTGEWEYIVDGEFEEGIYTATAYVTKNGYGSDLAEPVTFNVGTTQSGDENVVEEAGELDFALSYIMKSDFYNEYRNNTDLLIYTVGILVLGLLLGLLIHRFLFVRGEKNMEKTFKQMLSGDRKGGDKKEKGKKKNEKKKENSPNLPDEGTSATIIPLENDDEPVVEKEAPKEGDEDWVDTKVREEDEIPVFKKEDEPDDENSKEDGTEEVEGEDSKVESEEENQEKNETEEKKDGKIKDENVSKAIAATGAAVILDEKSKKEDNKKKSEKDKKGIFSFLSRNKEDKKPKDEDDKDEDRDKSSKDVDLEEWVEERKRRKKEEEAARKEEESKKKDGDESSEESSGSESKESSSSDAESKDGEEKDVNEKEENESVESKESEDVEKESEEKAEDGSKKKQKEEIREERDEASTDEIIESELEEGEKVPDGMSREEFLKKFKEHDPDPEKEEKTGDMKEKLKGAVANEAEANADEGNKEEDDNVKKGEVQDNEDKGKKEKSDDKESDEVVVKSNSKLDESLLSKIESAGSSVENVQSMSLKELQELEGIGKVTAEKIYVSLHGEEALKKVKKKKKSKSKKKSNQKAIKKRNIKISLTSSD